ncbi:peptidylprolyl isomerase, partial [Klebsiella pneumoniae]|nr:peptidylprolyl isomerase [Klebsiella pneumoniae]
RALTGLAHRPLGYPDAYAPATGHAAGWPIGYDETRGAAWLTHCYGSVGVGRDLAPDTGTGGELYAVIGHAPRHLDRNIAVIGRVIEG